MSDYFIITVNNKTVFNSKWLDSEDPSYINSHFKIIRNPSPPDYFINYLPKNFNVVGFAEMGFESIITWLKKVFNNNIIIPIGMSELLRKAKSDILIDLHMMEWPDIIDNSTRCIILDIWAEAMQIASKDLNTIILQDWEYFINLDFYNTSKKEYFSSKGLDNWHLFKSVKYWYQKENKL